MINPDLQPLEPTEQRQRILDKLTDLCALQGMTNVFISPGSRSAPMTLAFARNERICCRVVYDERSAAYMAMGLAQQRREPVGIVCTSGTAALNYAPAVTEAFYQQIPLIVLTADRPPEWIDQQDNQSIHQNDLYAPHCRGSFTLPVDLAHADSQHFAYRIINEAFHLAMGLRPGPVHINVPLREPLYTQATDRTIEQTPTKDPAKVIERLDSSPQLSQAGWDQLLNRWQQSKRILIIAGSHPPDEPLWQALLALSERSSAVTIIADVTANLGSCPCVIPHSDMILGTQNLELCRGLQPELIIQFGGPLVSKYLKLFLRSHPPIEAWYLQPDGPAPDTYQSLTHVVPMQPAAFFRELVAQLSSSKSEIRAEKYEEEHRRETTHDSSDVLPQSEPNSVINGSTIPFPNNETEKASLYTQLWQWAEQDAQSKVRQFFTNARFGEFVAIAQILAHLPAGSYLQVGNSMAIRYVNFIASLGQGLAQAKDAMLGQSVALGNIDESESSPVIVHSNRGTSGIDGTVSTAVGAALADDQLTTLVVGDLAFFYDRNGLWHEHLPANLRIVLLNNHGGGIFDMIDGPSQLDKTERKQYFLTPQPLTAERTAADHGCDYLHCGDRTSLIKALPDFFTPNDRPVILEITTDMDINTQVFQEFKALVRTVGMKKA